MHLKIIPPNSWDFGVAPVSLIKWSSRGLIGHDLGILEKRAGSEFADLARHIKLAAGEIPLHLIAMGSTEHYGPNRNGDGFGMDELRKHAQTFVKDAMFYRNHKNKNPRKSYGVVKLAYVNEAMGRIELLAALNATKEAAKRNGGFIADDEMSLLDAGKDLPVSMACKVAHDVCSICGNKARNRTEYCKSAEEGGSCDLFGCVNGLTKVANDGRIQFVHNPGPSFFDISKVGRNADPIAWGSVADYLQKAASADDHVLGGAELAEQYGIVPPLSMALHGVADPAVRHQIKLAYQLAELEDEISNSQYGSRRDNALALAFHSDVQPPLDIEPLGKVGSEQFAAGMQALARQNVLLSTRDFAGLFSGGDSVKAASLADQMSGALPGSFNRLIAGNDLCDSVSRNPFKPSRKLASAAQRQWAEKCAATHSLAPERVQVRSSLMAIRDTKSPGRLEKSAACTGEAATLAGAYALYKLAFLAEQQDEVALTSELAVRQNYVS